MRFKRLDDLDLDDVHLNNICEEGLSARLDGVHGV